MKTEKLYDILMADTPSAEIKKHEDEIFEMIPELETCKGFEQNNVWHVYDVYNHILAVVDGVPKDLALRLTALFHDTGKPQTYTESSDGIGHFFCHWDASAEIFSSFVKKYGVDDNLAAQVKILIKYHDFNILKADPDVADTFLSLFDIEMTDKLFLIKHADLMAQNPKFHAEVIESLKEQKAKIIESVTKRQ